MKSRITAKSNLRLTLTLEEALMLRDELANPATVSGDTTTEGFLQELVNVLADYSAF